MKIKEAVLLLLPTIALPKTCYTILVLPALACKTICKHVYYNSKEFAICIIAIVLFLVGFSASGQDSLSHKNLSQLRDTLVDVSPLKQPSVPRTPRFALPPYKANNDSLRFIPLTEQKRQQQQKQQQRFQSVKWNYSSETGLDPSIKKAGSAENFALPELNNGKSFPGNNLQHPENPSLPDGKSTEKQWNDTRSNLDKGKLSQNLNDAILIKSENLLMKLYDSLLSKDIKPPAPPEFIQKKEMPKEELVDMINKEFNSSVGKQKDSLQNGIGGYQQKGDSLRNTDLSRYQLSRIDAGNLKPLAGNSVDKNIMGHLDSVRQGNLLKQGYTLQEKIVSEKDKLTQLQKKQNFLDRSYFEGLLGLQQNELTLIQISPALGYHLWKIFSVGAGPNLTLTTNVGKAPKLSSRASARTFVKAELWKQRVYLQTEDGMELVRNEADRSIAHTVLAGVGGLVPFTKSLALNMAVFYRVYHTKDQPGSSPWVFRIGISTVKSKETKKK